MIQKLKSRGLVPALVVSMVLAAALFAPAPVGASVRHFLTTAYPPPPACQIVSFVADKTSPQPNGTIVTFTASSSGCASPQYKYYVQFPNGTWILARDWGGSVYPWQTPTSPAGTYNIIVWARNTGSTAAYEAYSTIMPFTLTAPVACTAAGLTANKTSPQQIDFQIVFTATSASCPNPEYLFYLQAPDGSWSIVRGYGGPTWTWVTLNLASIGTYNVNVWVRQAGSGIAVQTNFIMPFTLTDRVCTAAGLTADHTSPQAHGVVIDFAAQSASCARPEYQYYLKGPGLNGTWSIVRPYASTTDWGWATAGVASIGTYEVNVWVRAIGSPSAVQTNAVMYFTLT